MRWMLRDALVHEPDSERFIPHTSLVVENGVIADIAHGSPVEGENFDRIVDGSELLVLPGLVNAHLHSHDRFDRGRFDAETLEPWMALYNPPLGRREWTPRDVYLRTLLNCIDLLRSGTTLVMDDVRQPMKTECVEAVYQAYHDSGLRAVVSAACTDGPYAKSVPFLEEELPEDYRRRLARPPTPSSGDVFGLWRRIHEKWHGRVGFAVSPSAVQRCTEAFLKQAWALAAEWGVPVLTHLLETRVQKATGPLIYGKSLVRHMADLGLLTPFTTLIHAVWVTDEEIALIAGSGAGVVHNPVSNMKLGSGIAPVRKLLDAGVTVGIGTDNNCANDNANILEAMKAAVLLSRPEEPDKNRWITARDCLRMATRNGAGLTPAGSRTGRLVPGMCADFIAFHLRSPAFTPLNDPLHQLVFCENGASLSMVVIDGETVMDAGEIRTFDEQRLLREAHERSAEIVSMIQESSKEGPALARCVSRACARSLASHPTLRSL